MFCVFLKVTLYTHLILSAIFHAFIHFSFRPVPLPLTQLIIVNEARHHYNEEQAKQASALSSISLAAVTSYFSIHSAKDEDKDEIGRERFVNP